ncbi:lipopolysaccharide assembly protein LapA domain-containing protein [Shewanella sp.]|nr:lipopolysaccharide assembly protein LapA domain-containing protein [Shewanella sp.]
MKSFIIAVLVAGLFFIALIFGARNEQIVTISYFVAQGEFRLPVVLAFVFLSGFLLSWLFAMYHIAALKLTIRRLKKQAVNNDNAPVDPVETTAKSRAKE